MMMMMPFNLVGLKIVKRKRFTVKMVPYDKRVHVMEGFPSD